MLWLRESVSSRDTVFFLIGHDPANAAAIKSGFVSGCEGLRGFAWKTPVIPIVTGPQGRDIIWYSFNNVNLCKFN